MKIFLLKNLRNEAKKKLKQHKNNKVDYRRLIASYINKRVIEIRQTLYGGKYKI